MSDKQPCISIDNNLLRQLEAIQVAEDRSRNGLTKLAQVTEDLLRNGLTKSGLGFKEKWCEEATQHETMASALTQFLNEALSPS